MGAVPDESPASASATGCGGGAESVRLKPDLRQRDLDLDCVMRLICAVVFCCTGFA